MASALPHLPFQTASWGERLLVRAIRGLAGGDCGQAVGIVMHECGPMGPLAVQALAAFVGLLAIHGARPVMLAPATALDVTGDERRLLDAFALAQAGAWPEADEQLGRIAEQDPPHDLRAAMAAVAEAFASAGLMLTWDSPSTETAVCPFAQKATQESWTTVITEFGPNRAL